MKKGGSAWWALALGCLLTGMCVYGLATIDNGYEWRGVFIPIWNNWLLLPVGILIMVLAIRGICRGDGKPVPYTDEDATKAEAELDRLYLREHGKLPEKAKSGKAKVNK